MASIKNKIARSKVHRASRKATNATRAVKPVPQKRDAPSIMSLWFGSRGMDDKVPKRFRPNPKES